MAADIAGVFSTNLQEKIANSKILVVGAGGIGCEILKNLVLSGFPDIEIIDLDTIDVSNLNRQFLFHKEHVGKSKAEVARESALSFNPNTKIKAYHDSITTTSYGVNFFQRFNVVLNALDNRQARNHVNRMCLNADIPLIESGTAGYNGQVELIKKGLTQCYECTPKAAQKSYPGCTIRNTPSEPIHCIVWAKHLFNQLFGESNDDEDVSPDTADPEAGGDAGTNALETDANEKGNVKRVNTRAWAESIDYNVEKIFNKLFFDDINYLLSMKNLWKNRTPPTPMKWDEISSFNIGDSAEINQSAVILDQRVLSLCESVKVFHESVDELNKELKSLANNDHLVWDKDDKYGMNFVSSCANIRARIFGIQQKSRFEIKSMAGNIIPAIATTNAITAGVVVMHAFKVLNNDYDSCKSVYMRLRTNARNQLFVPDKYLSPPNPKCYVCSDKPTVTLQVDTNKMTVKEFKDDVLIKALNMVEPDVTLDLKGVIVISSEEGETDCNNDKKLSELDITDGCILKVDDFFQQYELTIVITHADSEYDKPLFEIISDLDSVKLQDNDKTLHEKDLKNGDNKRIKLSNDMESEKSLENNIEDDDDDDCEIIEEITKSEAEFDDTGAGTSNSGNNSSSHILAEILSNKEKETMNIEIDLDSSSDDDVVEINSSPTAFKRKPTIIDNDEPTCTKRAKMVEECESDDDDLIVLDD